jgi:hypothetical protein
MTPDDLLACAARIAPSNLARVRLRKDNSLGTLVPPGRDGKHLVIALDGKRGPPVRRLAKDVILLEQDPPPPPKLAQVGVGRVRVLLDGPETAQAPLKPILTPDLPSCTLH